MRIPKTKITSAILLSLICSRYDVVFSQSIDENQMLRYYIDNTFSRLDKSNISTGLLADYAIDLIEWSNYNGGSFVFNNSL